MENTCLFKRGSVFSLDSKQKISHSSKRLWNNPNQPDLLLHHSVEALFLGAWGVCNLGIPSTGLQGMQHPLKCAHCVCKWAFSTEKPYSFY